MQDEILRLTIADGAAVAFIARSLETVEKARVAHNSSPVVTVALGRLLTGAAMMGLMLDDDSYKLSVLIKGDGPVGSLLATANNQGQVKGFALNPQVEVANKPNGKLDVAGVIGKGNITVIKDVGGTEPFAGTVELLSSEIAEDLAYYYVQSEQTPSAIALGVLVDPRYQVAAAGGFIVQLLPGAEANLADKLEEKILQLGPVTDFYRQGGTPEELAEALFSELGYRIHSRSPLDFYCSCSKDKLASVLVSLGRQELEKMIREDEGAEVWCHFCNKSYHFSAEELTALLPDN